MGVATESPYPSFALAAPAAVVLQRLADDSDDDSDRARWLANLSYRLASLGRPEQALAANQEAVTLYRQLAEARPDAFLHDLAAALTNLANTLSLLNRHADASLVQHEADAAHLRVRSGTGRTR